MWDLYASAAAGSVVLVVSTPVRIPGCATIPLGSNLGKLFTHTASPVSQLQETGVQKGVFGA